MRMSDWSSVVCSSDLRNPMQETMLKGHKLVALIGVPVGFVAVKQAGYLNQVKLETQHIALFFKHRYRQTSRPLVEGTGIHHIKRMLLYKRLVVPRQYHPVAQACLLQVLG